MLDMVPQQKIIVVTGVESTGKTTLCKDIANKLNQPYIPEFAREYLNKRNGKYDYEDIEELARLQLEAVRSATSEYVLVDTFLIVLKIWSEEKFGKCSRFILNELAEFNPAVYLLCDIDVSWEPDALREHPMPEDRQRLHQNYVAHLQEQASPFIILSGTKKEQLDKAAHFIKNLL